MKRLVFMVIIATVWPFLMAFWGFYGHRRINYMAVFTLPADMNAFYKANISYLTDAATDPDRRRYAVEGEAERHFIDLDHFGESAIDSIPHAWKAAVARFGEDSLRAHGIAPWNIQFTYLELRKAFLIRDPVRILRLSAELGHYIADANVPLHTTENYDGQLTGQEGIHGLWESRLPELFADHYTFFVGRATYVTNTQEAAWEAVISAHQLVPAVLKKERELSSTMDSKKYSYETRGRRTVKVYSRDYAEAYEASLDGMVEQQMRKSIRMIGNFWYTAWVDAGQPDLDSLLIETPAAEMVEQRKREVAEWEKARKERGKAVRREGNASSPESD